MTPDLIDLGRRAVKCKRWRWMPGMMAACECPGDDQAFSTAPAEWTGTDLCRVREESLGGALEAWTPLDGWWPDFSDPATLGCLLALVREAWGEPTGTVALSEEDWPLWRWYCDHDENAQYPHWGPTEAHALVAALEAAPEAP